MRILVSSRFFGVFLCVWILGMLLVPGIHFTQKPWFDGCITLSYGEREGGLAEHGNDLACFPSGTPISALLSGRVTFAGYTSFGFYEVTWRLNHPWIAHGSPYAYVEDMQSLTVHTGQNISQGQIIGYSKSWVEFGLTPDWAYGVSNWRWGINSLFLIQEARAGTLPRENVSTTVQHILPHRIILPRTVCVQAPILSVLEARTCAMIAGFSRSSLRTIVAIAIAESSLRTNAIGVVGEVGILQFALYYHPEVSRSCALNAECSFQAAYFLSNGGRDFTAWTTYDNGAYLRYLP